MVRDVRLKALSLAGVMFYGTYRWIFPAILLGLLFSCHMEDETGVPPVIELIAEPGYIAGQEVVIPGTEMSFKVKMQEGSERMTNFYIETVQEGGSPVRYFDTAMFIDHFVWTGSFYKSSSPSEKWTFVVRDRRGGAGHTQLTVLADTASGYGPVKQLGNVLLGAQDNQEAGGFYSFTLETRYQVETAMEHQEMIDLVFYFGPDALTIASPGANIEEGIFPAAYSPVSWEVRNTTRYIKTSMTSGDFDQVVNDSALIALYVDADGKRKAKNLDAGEVYVFKDHQNRLGLFRVNMATGSSEAEVNLDIKIQPGK